MSVTLEEIMAPIRSELEEVEHEIARRVRSSVESVTQIASHLVGAGGKRLRPALCLLAARLFGSCPRTAIQMASAIELIHAATLLHDDVIDQAVLRRGQPSANALWGNKASILVGDYLYCRASSMIAEVGSCELLGLISEATAVTTEGEVQEVIESNDIDLGEASYLEMIGAKTAHLLGCAAEVGALLGGASKAHQKRLFDFGRSLGMAFQLIDDALDYTSSDETIGKSIGTDLREGKLTLPLIHTLKHASLDEKTAISTALSKKADLLPIDLEIVLQSINRHSGLVYTLSYAETFVAEAKTTLLAFQDSPARLALIQLAEYVLERKH